MFFNIELAIKAIHDMKILHRDLKSANVFLCKDGTVKIGDMNVSKIAKKGLLYTQTGTPYFASPEVWNERPYDSKSDIWSCGCLIYEMAALKVPFRAESMEGLYKRVINGKFKKLPSHFSVDLNNFVKLMLKVNPMHRASAEKLLSLPMIKKRMNPNSDEIENDLNPNMLQTIRMPNNIHYLTDRLPKANYLDIVDRSSSKFDVNKIKAERTMPVMGESDEVLDKNERSNFLADIKKKSRVRNQSAIKKEIYTAR
jgi:NIMA (never in mitosis gene a)-related kinase